MSLKQNTKIASRNHKGELNRLALAIFIFFILNLAFVANADAASSSNFKLDPEPEHSVSGEYASSSSYALNDQVTYVAFAPVSSSSNYKVAEGIPSLEVYPTVEEEAQGGGGSGGGGNVSYGSEGSDSISLGEGAAYEIAPSVELGEETSVVVPTTESEKNKTTYKGESIVTDNISLDTEPAKAEAETNYASASATKVQAVASMMFVLFFLLFLLFLLMIYLEKRVEDKK